MAIENCLWKGLDEAFFPKPPFFCCTLPPLLSGEKRLGCSSQGGCSNPRGVIRGTRVSTPGAVVYGCCFGVFTPGYELIGQSYQGVCYLSQGVCFIPQGVCYLPQGVCCLSQGGCCLSHGGVLSIAGGVLSIAGGVLSIPRGGCYLSQGVCYLSHGGGGCCRVLFTPGFAVSGVHGRVC